ncbi:5-amino-6-(5-phospho-D-ribitylamino)uracil phosphatase YigB [Vibrio hepatarius]|uniref:5-amino-6-(5-phospho-D-ribitylamino)uracil phosphatase YigB n=1 Tax=Vibrio hepatarius TaxID=171383 RepID=UPI001C09957E|nr:5-amino-6-(5-phospho-D-ribitylamino)uracil phosphatase YigB [Vibrio hepatarius]MBU2897557.1 5-amino-6-(5-phospho-D-ribitylamino)uracil phosphatase YigB [Vibrio hepatarius]
MRFFRPLAAIHAMTFDLDDTLYDNHPVIKRLETEFALWLHKFHPISTTQPMSWWHKLKNELVREDSWLANDLSLWRYKQIETGLFRLGYKADQAKQAAEEAMQQVSHLRSDFEAPWQTHQVMEDLAKCIPLVAITNGNVDVERIGLANYFSLILKSGRDGYAKPNRQLFDKAVEHLQLPSYKVLHVGDHLLSDVQGAKNSGLQACWFNDQCTLLTKHSSARVLPDVEISSLTELPLLVNPHLK